MQSVMYQVLSILAPQMRCPGPGLGGFLAEKLMEFSNPPSIRKGIERLDIQPSDTIVELGSGHGVGIQEIVSRNPRRIVAVEISERFHAKLKNLQGELGASSFELYDSDAKSMSFLDDCTVDKMFAMNVVYFLDPLEEYLKEIHRVLKLDGMVVFGCKFHALKGAAPPFINIEPAPIMEAMKQTGFEVTSEKIELESPTYSYVEIKGTKRN